MSRRSVALTWAATALLLWLAVLTGVTLAFAYAGVLLHFEVLTFAGAAAGLLAATAVCSRAARWVQALRLRGLRRHGVRADARVDRLDTHRVGGRGAYVRYTVRVTWPAYHGRRDYRFDRTGPADFPRRCASGETVAVLYPPGRPHRFVIDLPYAAGMTDQFS